MWLFSGAPEVPEDDTEMEMHGTDQLYSAMKSLLRDIQIEGEHARWDAVHRLIQTATTRTMRR
jgi:hypothetical protein